MREIKFREWDPLREKMLGKGMSYSKREEFDDSVNFRFDHEEDLNFSNRLEETDEAGTPLRKLMQYTGLKDNNGTEIYEGDILNIIEVTNEGLKEYLTDVKWEDCSFVVKSGEDDYDTFLAAWTGDPNYTYPLFEIQIIGNIYENPESLEVE